MLNSGIPISYSSVTTKFSTSICYPTSYSYQLTLHPTGTPFSYFYQLLLPTPISYCYPLLVTGSRYYPLMHQLLLTVSATFINQSFQLFRYCYQVTLSYTPISFSHQPFLSGTFISHFYLIYQHTPIRYSNQNFSVTNHYQLQYHKLLGSCLLQRFFRIGVPKNFAILTGKHLRC